MLIMKIEIFSLINQYCQFSRNRVLREKERSKKKTVAFLDLGFENFICSSIVFHYLRPNIKFTVKGIFFQKSENFDDFLTSKHDIFRTVGPILGIFSENA